MNRACLAKNTNLHEQNQHASSPAYAGQAIRHFKNNFVRMKRKLLFGAAFLFVVWAATSCEALSDCKFCKMVTTDSATGDVTDGFETEYCGADLIAIEAKTPTTTGTLTTTWSCR